MCAACTACKTNALTTTAELLPCLSMQRSAVAMLTAVTCRSATFTSPVLRTSTDCRYSDYNCSPSTFSTVSSALRFTVFCIAVIMFSGFLCRTFRQLRNRPYR